MEEGETGKSDVTIPGSVCFLVREHAKSLLAIQGLQRQVERLETMLMSSGDMHGSLKDVGFVSSGSESDSREGGDGAADSGYSGGNKDELLLLLEKIGQRGQFLQQQVEELKKSCDPQLRNRYNKLEKEYAQLCAEKRCWERERDQLTEHLASVVAEKQRLQQQLCLLQLQMRGRTKGNASTAQSSPKLDSRTRISLILKETNVLELQRQLLGYVMENDVLQAKLSIPPPASLGSLSTNSGGDQFEDSLISPTSLPAALTAGQFYETHAQDNGLPLMDLNAPDPHPSLTNANTPESICSEFDPLSIQRPSIYDSLNSTPNNNILVDLGDDKSAWPSKDLF